jgi:hypothetical protein
VEDNAPPNSVRLVNPVELLQATGLGMETPEANEKGTAGKMD